MADTPTPEALSTLDGLSDDDIDTLARDLGIVVDDDDDNGTGTNGEADGTPDATPDPKVVDGSDGGTPTPDDKGSPQSLTGAALLEAFKNDPAAQALVKEQTDKWLADASAQADAQKEQEAFQELVKTGNFEEIGRRYVTAESEKVLKESAAQEAMTQAYGQVYSKLFKEIESFGTLTDAEKQRIDSKQYETDAEYVLGLTNFIADKKGGTDLDAKVKAAVEEKLTTLKNMKSASAARGSSVTGLPGGTPSPDNNRKMDSRTLISEGFSEFLEERADARGAVVNQ